MHWDHSIKYQLQTSVNLERLIFGPLKDKVKSSGPEKYLKYLYDGSSLK